MQAWVFAAFEDPQRAPIYYTNALIYAVPALSRGFNLDTFSVLCLLAGIAHVQVPTPPCTLLSLLTPTVLFAIGSTGRSPQRKHTHAQS